MRKEADKILVIFLVACAFIGLGVLVGNYLASRFGEQRANEEYPYFQTVEERFQEDEMTDEEFIPPISINGRTEKTEFHLIVFRNDVLGGVRTFPDKKPEVFLLKRARINWKEMEEDFFIGIFGKEIFWIVKKEGGMNFPILELEVSGGEKSKK